MRCLQKSIPEARNMGMHVGRELAAGNRDLTSKRLLEEEELTKKKKSGKRPKERCISGSRGHYFWKEGVVSCFRAHW